MTTLLHYIFYANYSLFIYAYNCFILLFRLKKMNKHKKILPSTSTMFTMLLPLVYSDKMFKWNINVYMKSVNKYTRPLCWLVKTYSDLRRITVCTKKSWWYRTQIPIGDDSAGSFCFSLSFYNQFINLLK